MGKDSLSAATEEAIIDWLEKVEKEWEGEGRGGGHGKKQGEEPKRAMEKNKTGEKERRKATIIVVQNFIFHVSTLGIIALFVKSLLKPLLL